MTFEELVAEKKPDFIIVSDSFYHKLIEDEILTDEDRRLCGCLFTVFNMQQKFRFYREIK